MRSSGFLGNALLFGSLLCAGSLIGPGCNLGPFPNFLERLDPLRPVEGEVKGWIFAGDEETQVLVLSRSGRFLHSTIGRDTSVRLETGSFEIDGSEVVMRSEYRYVFPQESGPINGREGAQSEEIDVEKRRPAEQDGERLTIAGLGPFVSTSDYVLGLDLETRAGRGCLLKYIQLSIRTIQARIRSFGGGGTVMYHNNKSSFVGFLSGEQTIVVENLLSPDTTIAYHDFQDFPEVLLDGSFVSHVNTSGDGTLDESVNYTIFDTSREVDQGLGGARGLGGAGGVGGARGVGGAAAPDGSAESGRSDASRRILASGRLIYGPKDPIRIEQADVAGGSYDFEMDEPTGTSDNFSWEFLADLDLRGCSVLPAD